MSYMNKDLRKTIILLVFKQLLAILVGMVDTINIFVINITAALATSVAVMVTVTFLAAYGPLLHVIFGQIEPEIMENVSIYRVIAALSICPLAIYNFCAALLQATND